MADDYVQEYLVKWELQGLIPSFNEHGIDRQTFHKLSKDLIRELIPHLGPRIKFLGYWKEIHTKEGSTPIKETESHHTTTEKKDYSIEASSSTDSDSQESDKEQISPNHNHLKRQRCFVGESMFRMVNRPQVREILESSMQGRAVIKSYKKNNILTRKSRALIVDIVITEILKDLKTPLKNEDFDYISKDILMVFPTEIRSTYYVTI